LLQLAPLLTHIRANADERFPMLDPRDFSVIETLRDGRKIEVRAQRQQDRNDLEAAILRLSDESLYRRFFIAKRRFSEQEAEHFLNIDFVNHVALVAAAHENSKQAIVGAGRYIVLEPGTAEVAFSVVDEYQGQGIGTALMRNLSLIARQAGLSKLIAEVLVSNAAMLRVFENSGLEMSTGREGSVVHVTLTCA
jgi:RimJ/RimL family protein N-acetyltransferase